MKGKPKKVLHTKKVKPKNRNSLPDDLGRIRERKRMKDEERKDG